MIKKKAKATGKKAAKESSKTKSSVKKSKEPHPAEVRKEVSLMVHEVATEMTQAVIDEGKKGQLATVKYLFEMAGVFPAAIENAEGTPEEDCLAQTLLTRLNIPLVPVNRDDDDDEPVEIGKPAKADDEDEEDAADEGEIASGNGGLAEARPNAGDSKVEDVEEVHET